MLQIESPISSGYAALNVGLSSKYLLIRPPMVLFVGRNISLVPTFRHHYGNILNPRVYCDRRICVSNKVNRRPLPMNGMKHGLLIRPILRSISMFAGDYCLPLYPHSFVALFFFFFFF